MSKANLTDLLPQPAEFMLEATGDSVHRLRPFNLQDRAWASQVYGGEEGIRKAFLSDRIEAFMPLIYRILEDKSPFPARQKSSWYGDDGVFYYVDPKCPELEKAQASGAITEKASEPKRLPGWEAMLQTCTGIADHLILKSALFKAIGLSNPEIEAEAEEYKKKVRALIRRATEETGEKSFTPSPSSTDGASSTSAP